MEYTCGVCHMNLHKASRQQHEAGRRHKAKLQQCGGSLQHLEVGLRHKANLQQDQGSLQHLEVGLRHKANLQQDRRSLQHPEVGLRHKANLQQDGGSLQQPETGRRHKTNCQQEEYLNKVFVTGFPEYTQTRDLERAFNRFDYYKIEKIINKTALVAFRFQEDAESAIQSNNINVYGSFLIVKPYRPAQHDHVRYIRTNNRKTSPKQNIPGRETKEKDKMVDPKDIDLSGNFLQQVGNILSSIRLKREEVEALHPLYQHLETLLQQLWTGCEAMPFGSITTGLGIKTSDADCFIHIKNAKPNPSFVIRTKRILQQYPNIFTDVICIPRANTPICKFFHIPTETNCDVSFKTPLGVRNSRLLEFLLHLDPRLIPLALLIKYWAKVHGLTGTGRLSNYTLVLLVVFYLQRPPTPLLPTVVRLQAHPEDDHMVDCWNTGFMNHSDRIPASSDTSSIAELLGGFFEFYSSFNFAEAVISPFAGRAIERSAFTDTRSVPEEFTLYKRNVTEGTALPLRVDTPLCVQDPFEQCHNVACGVGSKLRAELEELFKFVAEVYRKEKPNGCEGFLRVILLQRPKVTKRVGRPEFRVNLSPRLTAAILDPDWKVRVRDALFVIFQNILRVSLVEEKEPERSDAKVEKERFAVRVERLVWKRRRHEKTFSSRKLPFVDKQAKITQAILNCDQRKILMDFHLMLVYSEDRKAVVKLRFVNGDVQAFIDFGRFCVANLYFWFLNVLNIQFGTEPEADGTGDGPSEKGLVSSKVENSST